MHSSIHWKVKHNGASWFYGRFRNLEGSFVFDESNPAKCEVTMEVDASSVDTRTEKLDGHLRSPDFFDVKQFPKLTFESKKVKKSGDKYHVTGELSLHGVTKEITIEMEHTGSGNDGAVQGFHTSFTIDRTDFGMNYGIGGIGKEVEIIISIEAGKG